MKINFHTPIIVLIFLLESFGYTSTKNLGLESNDVAESFISININWLFDKVLKEYRNKLIEEGKTEMTIDNFEEHFSTKVFIFNIEGHMSVTDGSLKNLTSIQRTGDVILDKDGDTIMLTAYIGMTDFQVTYKQYELALMTITQRGNIHAVVGTNSVCAKILLTLKPECRVQLKSLELENLGDIDISVTGLGPMNDLADDISSWVVTHIAHSYKINLQNLIFSDVEKAIVDADLCHHLPF